MNGIGRLNTRGLSDVHNTNQSRTEKTTETVLRQGTFNCGPSRFPAGPFCGIAGRSPLVGGVYLGRCAGRGWQQCGWELDDVRQLGRGLRSRVRRQFDLSDGDHGRADQQQRFSGGHQFRRPPDSGQQLPAGRQSAHACQRREQQRFGERSATADHPERDPDLYEQFGPDGLGRCRSGRLRFDLRRDRDDAGLRCPGGGGEPDQARQRHGGSGDCQ